MANWKNMTMKYTNGLLTVKKIKKEWKPHSVLKTVVLMNYPVHSWGAYCLKSSQFYVTLDMLHSKCEYLR